MEPLYNTPENMKVDEADGDERVEDHAETEVDENQPPILQLPARHDLRRSTKVSRPPRSLSPQVREPAHN